MQKKQKKYNNKFWVFPPISPRYFLFLFCKGVINCLWLVGPRGAYHWGGGLKNIFNAAIQCAGTSETSNEAQRRAASPAPATVPATPPAVGVAPAPPRSTVPVPLGSTACRRESGTETLPQWLEVACLLRAGEGVGNLLPMPREMKRSFVQCHPRGLQVNGCGCLR